MHKPSTYMVVGVLVLSMFVGLLVIGPKNAWADVVPGGVITSDTTWDKASSPWYIDGDVYVEDGANLTIEAGCEVRFNGFYKLCIGNGSLYAVGSVLDRIWFTSNQPSPWNEDWYGIQVNATGIITLDYCNITWAQYSVDIYYGCNNSIRNSNITYGYDGIKIYRSANNTVVDNIILNNLYVGVLVSESSKNAVENNNISANGWNGLHFYLGHNNNISGNKISNNFQRGLYLYGSTYNNITKNILSFNKGGIYVGPTSLYNNIINNNISTNTEIGINVTSPNNRVFSNVFWGNPVQARDESINNHWDDGYPIGGNYWTDFDEPAEDAYDNFSGPDQTELGGDGIVDLPYTAIQGGTGAQDSYPLMQPATIRTFVYLMFPINGSVMKPGTTMDFEVIGENIDFVNYTVNGGADTPLPSPYDINDTVTGGWTDGPYTINITLHDSEGNISLFMFQIIVDSIFPQIMLNSPAKGSLVTPGTPIDLAIIDDNLKIVNFTLDLQANQTIDDPFDIDTTLWFDGNRTILVYAQDKAGHLNFTSYNFTLDGTIPNISTVLPLTNNSVVKPGTFLRFNITDLHLDPGTVGYTVNGGSPQSFNLTTFYEINTTGWPDGPYLINVSAMDTLGNLNIKSYTFGIDAVPPVISLISPSNNSIIKEGDMLIFSIIDSNLDWVTVYENGVFAGIFYAPYQWNITNKTDGPFTIRIEALDKAVNFNSSFYNFTVATPPLIILNWPMNNSLISAGMSIDLTIQDINLAAVNYTLNFDFGNTTPLASPYDINTSSWEDGEYWVKVSAVDVVGNNNFKLYFFTIDSTPPLIEIVSPANNSFINPENPLVAVLQFSVEDDNLAFVTNSTNNGPATQFNPPYRIDTYGWPDGEYTIRIQATDALGLKSTKEFVIIIDSTPPAIDLLSPPNGSSLEVSMQINLSISDENLLFVNYTLNTLDKGNIPPPYVLSTSSFPDGNCTIEIGAVDRAGNIQTRLYFFVLNDTTAPVITVKSPQNISCIPLGTLIEFIIYDIYLQNASYAIDGSAPVEFTSPYIVDTNGWMEGLHTLTVRAYDTRNNLKEMVYNIIADYTRPSIYLLSPSNNSAIAPGVQILLEITEANLALVEYSIDSASWHEVGAPHAIQTASWDDGETSLTIRALDLAGNEIKLQFRFIIDSKPPKIILVNPINGSLVVASDIIDILVMEDNLDYALYSLNGGTNVSFSSPFDINASTLSEGSNSIHVFALDLAGNHNESVFTIVLDSIAPWVLSRFAAEPFYPYNNTRIIITFSEPMDTTSVEVGLKIEPGINYSVKWYNNGQEMWLDRITGLQFQTRFTLTFNASVSDIAGNNLVNFSGYSFVTDTDEHLDSDNDGMPDGWEFRYGLDFNNPDDAQEDLDKDGYTNLQEFLGDSDPTNPSSIPKFQDGTTLEFWWIIPILVALLVISIVLFLFLLKERQEEPKTPVDEVEDMYLSMRAQRDIEAMEALLSDKERLGERSTEAEIMLRKAKEAFAKGDYNIITVYEQTLRNLLTESDLIEGSTSESAEGKPKREKSHKE